MSGWSSVMWWTSMTPNHFLFGGAIFRVISSLLCPFLHLAWLMLRLLLKISVTHLTSKVICFYTLRCCVAFCHTTTWVGSKYSCIPSLSPHPTPRGCHRAPGVLPVLHSSFPLAIDLTYDNIYTSKLLSIHPTLFSPHWVHKSGSLCLSLFLPCK